MKTVYVIAGDKCMLHEYEYLLKRKIIEKDQDIIILGKTVDVKASIADTEKELAIVIYRGIDYQIDMKWIRKKQKRKPPKRLGSEDAKIKFNKTMWKQRKLLTT